MTRTKSSILSRRIYDRVVSEFVEPCATQLGFERRSGDEFIQWRDDCLWRIGCDFRRVRGRDEGWLTIGVSVGFRSLAEFLAPCAEVNVLDPKRPVTMAANLGDLFPPYQWREWRLLPDTDAHEVGREVAGALKLYGQRFFGDFGTIEKCVAAWEAGTPLMGCRTDFYLPAVYWLRGERERARILVREQIALYGRLWKEKGRRSDHNMRISREEFLRFLESKA